MERAIKIGHPIFFGSLVVFSIVLMSLCAFLVDRFNQNDNAPTNGISNTVRYLLCRFCLFIC